MDVILFTGFLGSGKTTLLLETAAAVLNEGTKRLKIIENDAGSVSVDSAIIRQRGISVKEIYAGCVCCSLKSEFRKAIWEICEEGDCDILLIEPSGLAGPDALKEVFDGMEDLKLRTIFVLDCNRLTAGNSRILPFMQRSIELSETILMNKIDCLTQEKFQECLDFVRLINRTAEILIHKEKESAVPLILSTRRDNTAFAEGNLAEPPLLRVRQKSAAPDVSVLTEYLEGETLSDTKWIDYRERLIGFRRQLKREGCREMGHIKIVLRGKDDKNLIIQMTDWESEPSVNYTEERDFLIKDVILNSLIPEINDAQHRLCLKRSGFPVRQTE